VGNLKRAGRLERGKPGPLRNETLKCGHRGQREGTGGKHMRGGAGRPETAAAGRKALERKNVKRGAQPWSG
jgi:hypothetical protein